MDNGRNKNARRKVCRAKGNKAAIPRRGRKNSPRREVERVVLHRSMRQKQPCADKTNVPPYRRPRPPAPRPAHDRSRNNWIGFCSCESRATTIGGTRLFLPPGGISGTHIALRPAWRFVSRTVSSPGTPSFFPVRLLSSFLVDPRARRCYAYAPRGVWRATYVQGIRRSNIRIFDYFSIPLSLRIVI